jgi:hypothetical protein
MRLKGLTETGVAHAGLGPGTFSSVKKCHFLVTWGTPAVQTNSPLPQSTPPALLRADFPLPFP